MIKRKVNKDKQQEFLQLKLSEQITKLNNIIYIKGLEGISSELGFSYSWIKDKLEKVGIFYVASIKKFIIEDRGNSLDSKDVEILKEIIKDYSDFKNSRNNTDIRLVVGSCSEKTITRSMVIDEKINSQWNEFCKKNSSISTRDLVSSALVSFMNKYKKIN